MINKFNYEKHLVMLFIWFFTTYGYTNSPAENIKQEAEFSFIVTSDMREFAGPDFQSASYFLGTCLAIKETGQGVFMISPGDIDPPWQVRSTIDKVLGQDYIWYPVVGNHEAETRRDMNWLRNWGQQDIPYLFRRGPHNSEETTYSFNYSNSHFIVLNQYYNGKSDTGTNGDIVNALYNWLVTDLEANQKNNVFIFGHEPLVSIPDIDNGRVRHAGDNLDRYTENNHRFQKLLRKYPVKAYFCGNTHNASYAFINGIWQIDSGHCRGLGDTGAASTFVKVWVTETDCLVEFYRDDANGGDYKLAHSVIIQ